MENSKCSSCSNSLLTIFSKIFERVILNSLFNHFVRNKLFTNQAVFLPGDLCIAQFLLIIHEIQTNFDDDEDDELFPWYD